MKVSPLRLKALFQPWAGFWAKTEEALAVEDAISSPSFVHFAFFVVKSSELCVGFTA